jgi:hypothetical protein
MKITQVSFSDLNSGTFRTAHYIHYFLLKRGINSRLRVNEKKLDNVTVEDLNNKIGKVWNQLNS